MDAGFIPPRLLGNPHLQSVLAGGPPRSMVLRFLARDRLAAAESHVLDCGDGVRLQGFLDRPSPGTGPRGLVVLLHGWEGSAESAYLLSSAALLQDAGHTVFRLNLRDHGPTHHLNPGIFHSCRIVEVVGAVRAVAERFATRPLSLVGFSLGGNFALRVALRAPAAGIPLEWVVAVNPAIDPTHVMHTLEGRPRIYERHFIRKWRRSLRLKQQAFPERYEFSEWMRLRSLREKTRYLIERYSEFDRLETYLDGYSIAGDRVSGLTVPSVLITAEDDPIIPVADFRALRLSTVTRLEIHAGGGHCGFLEGPISSWIDRRIAEILAVPAAPW